MLESETFKESKQLWLEKRGFESAPSPAQVPVPGDMDLDDAFADAKAAEAFWDKHKCDKRAILE
eukprot:7810216-Pyramimonas_sp.AAC.1